MTAFDTFLAYGTQRKFNEYRQALAGHKKGTLSSGNFAESMNLAVDEATAAQYGDGQLPDKPEPIKLFQRIGKTEQPGFVFDLEGTEKAVSTIGAGGKLKLIEEFSGNFKFADERIRTFWDNSTAASRRKCIGKNVQELIRKTDDNYRTHGDRLHYFVVGQVTVTEKSVVRRYPLFLFSCSDIDKNSLQVQVEASGFGNFWLDKNYLGDLLMRTLKGYELSIDEVFPAKVNDIARKINTLHSAAFDSIACDLSYSSITVVTGFIAEYIDPVWNKVLAGQS